MAILTPKQMAELKASDLMFLEKSGEQSIRMITRQMQAEAHVLVKANKIPTPAIEKGFRELAKVMAPIAVRAHFHSIARERMLAGVGDIIELPRSTHERAIAFYQKRLEISDADLAKLIDQYGAHALRVTNKAGTFVSRRIEQALLETQQGGLHISSAVRSSTLRQALIDSGIDITTKGGKATLEQIVRTQTSLALAAGEGNARKDPALDAILWGYEYITVGDDRVRPEHAALHGTTAPKDHPIWDTITPPNGFNCRCIRVAIYVNEKSRQKIDLPPDELDVEVDGRTVRIFPKPDEDFNFNPAKLFEDVVIKESVSVAGLLPPPTPKTVVEQFDDKPPRVPARVKKALEQTGATPIVSPDLVRLTKQNKELEKQLADQIEKNQDELAALQKEIDDINKAGKVKPPAKKKATKKKKATTTPKARAFPEGTIERKANGGLKAGALDRDDFTKALTDEERKAIFEWTKEDYRPIRKAQRGKRVSAKTKRQSDALERVIARGKGHDGTVYRGIKKTPKQLDDFLAQLQRDGGFELDAMSSSTTSRRRALQFTSEKKKFKRVVLKIENKTGVDIARLSDLPNEDEILLRRGARYNFVGVETGSDGIIEISLKEI